jgi:hypothetical protein
MSVSKASACQSVAPIMHFTVGLAHDLTHKHLSLPVFSFGLVDVPIGSPANFAAFELKEVLHPLSQHRGAFLEFEIHFFFRSRLHQNFRKDDHQ